MYLGTCQRHVQSRLHGNGVRPHHAFPSPKLNSAANSRSTDNLTVSSCSLEITLFATSSLQCQYGVMSPRSRSAKKHWPIHITFHVHSIFEYFGIEHTDCDDCQDTLPSGCIAMLERCVAVCSLLSALPQHSTYYTWFKMNHVAQA